MRLSWSMVCVLGLAVLLSGCAMQTTSSPGSSTGLAIQGMVHGGQQPVVGAQVYLFAANTTGYGNASVSLLANVPGSTTLDSSGGPTNGDYYVTSGTGGSFTITGDYACTAGTQVYLYALGGNPGLASGTNNTASGLIAALGACPATGNFLTTAPFIVINEVSTVAAAYALSGFATDATHVSSSGTALANVGISNAFANVTNLEVLSTGASLAKTPSGNGTVPQGLINTLADILAGCVNTTGPSSTICGSLLSTALPGGTTGTAPTETATAAINIAHNPGANISALYGIFFELPPQAPFQPTLTAIPTDLTLALQFTGGGMENGESNGFPFDIAIDNFGNAWIPTSFGGAVIKLSNLGAVLSGSKGYAVGGSLNSIAIDPAGNAWLSDGPNGVVAELSNSGGLLSPAGGYSLGGYFAFNGIAIDGAGNIWIPGDDSFNLINGVVELSSSGAIISTPPSAGNPDGGYDPSGPYAATFAAIDGSGNAWFTEGSGGSTQVGVLELSNSGGVLSPATGYGVGSFGPGIAIDSSGSAWTPNLPGNSVSKISSSGTVTSGYTGGGLNEPVGIAIDGGGNVWVTNTVGVTELSNSGMAMSPATGYFKNTNLSGLSGIAIDGSGDVWLPTLSTSLSSAVVELIGAATPVVTPLSLGVKNNMLGTRP
jgi:hypothetical protein